MRRNPHTSQNWLETPVLREFWWDLTHPREMFRDFLEGLEDARELMRSWVRSRP